MQFNCTIVSYPEQLQKRCVGPISQRSNVPILDFGRNVCWTFGFVCDEKTAGVDDGSVSTSCLLNLD